MGRSSPRIIVIGVGIGGLTAASLLLKAGCDIIVLEAHVYPGGSAGSFYHKGYRFDAGATLAGLARNASPQFRTFLDAQLLISAQTTADKANALYGSAALDLPRRGVNHVRGGIGSLAKTLADWIKQNGGQVL